MASFSYINGLSQEQKYAFHKITSGKNVFVTGPGGTGKTKLIKHIVEWAKSEGKQIDVCAMTGCAAVLLNCGAKTLHSWSGIKLAKGPNEKIVAMVMKNKRAVANWKKARILVIDEVSMLSEKIFELCDAIGRNIRKIDRPFGGIQLIFTGDFYQLPPVGNMDDPKSERFCFESDRWFSTFAIENHVQLKTVFRQTDPKYKEILAQIREGELTEENIKILQARVKLPYHSEEKENCVLTKLFPLRSRAEYVNQAMYSKIEKEEVKCVCKKNTNCTTYSDSGTPIKTEDLFRCAILTEKEKETQLEYLIANSPCSDTFGLKIGTAVMCLVNLDVESGICNGSQGIVVGFNQSAISGNEYNPVVKFVNGITRTIERHVWQSDEYPTISISQYPLCLAWALTIHKIQGATMAMAEMDLGNSVFEYGQTYVALSRIQSLEGLYLSAFHAHRIKTNPKVKAFYASLPDISSTANSDSDANYVELRSQEFDNMRNDVETPTQKITDPSIKVIRL
jgi:ATP-dependent DNA helicase PIF1